MNRGCWNWRGGVVAILCCAGLLLASACEKSPEQKLRRAKVLLTQESKPDSAEEKLRAVLEEEPENIEAQRLMAKVHRLRGEHERAEEKLDELWEKYDFDDEGQQLSGRLRNARELIRSEYSELYRDWAREIEPEKRPDRYVEVLKKGLEYGTNDISLEISMKLAKFYWRRGQKLVEQGDKKEAAETFAKIRDLRTRRSWNKRETALERSRELRLEFFEQEARERFEKEGNSLIAELDGLELDDDEKTIRIDFTQNVDRQLNPDNEEDRKKAKRMAFVALVDKLRKLSLTLSGLSPETDLRKIGTDRAKEILLGYLEFDEEGRTFRRGRYEIAATLSVEKAIRMAYDVKTAYEGAEKEAANSGELESAGGGSSESTEVVGGDAAAAEGDEWK